MIGHQFLLGTCVTRFQGIDCEAMNREIKGGQVKSSIEGNNGTGKGMLMRAVLQLF